MHLTPLFSETDELEKIITVVTDITEEKKRDIEFQKLSLIAQHTQNPILITDANYKINWINQSFSNQLNYSLEELEGKEPGDLLFRDSVSSKHYPEFVQQIESGKMAKGDFIVYTREGNTIWMNVTVDPIPNSKGEITQFICLMQNIQEIKEAQAIIETKNKDITDSISYAQRIQDALLPNLRLVKQNLPKHFVFYRPKDIISGDFYFIEMYHHRVFIGIADCTGHGVPGAMMTSIGAAALNNAILDRKLTDPGKILTHVDGYLKASLSTSKESLNDGMDIGLISLNIATQEVEYCGAKRPLIIVRNDKTIKVVPGIKRSIGQFIMGEEFRFKTVSIPLEDTMNIYCFSDGLPDQFGGPNTKKIYQKNLTDFLALNAELSMKEQKQKLENFIDEWKGNLQQTDDMVLFGAKLTKSYFEKLKSVTSVEE
ncbi:MAG: SpoIIE family protein phosphatase [Flavobacteriales bacterium]|nr:SpoIIE family protein phosphatase [Flavobacteriales bacterium]